MIVTDDETTDTEGMMNIEIQTDQTFSAYQQFDPLELKALQFFHGECLGGAIELEAPDAVGAWFRCTACHASEAVSAVECRAALRRLLIAGGSEKVGNITFVPHGKSLKPHPAT